MASFFWRWSVVAYPSARWMPCHSWCSARWPGLDGLKRLLVAFLLWSTRSELRCIVSSSMYPTLRAGDHVVIEKASYCVRSPAINDIVTFWDPTEPPGERERCVFIKRIVAKAGDFVKVENGLLYVNGIARDENFVAEKPKYSEDLIRVPRDHVYVLGDNRNRSFDSHCWGPLPMENITGRFFTCCHRPSNN